MSAPLHSIPDLESFIGESYASAQKALMDIFRCEGVDAPDLEARILLGEASGLDRAAILANRHVKIPDQTATALTQLVKRRLSGEPIDSILGYSEFYGRWFQISKDVLSPRPETEELVDAALAVLQNHQSPHVLDMGTGSGAILITLLAEIETAKGVGVDISEPALDIARANAVQNEVTERSRWVQSDWFANVSGPFDLIVSNPPYINDAAMADLPREVADFDPDLALRGGETGVSAYAAILQRARDVLRPDGHLVVEIGYDQGQIVSDMFRKAGFENLSLIQDLSGHDRIISGRVI